MWIEPEAIGRESELICSHPEFEAMPDGRRYENPYICLGNDKARQWLFDMLCKVIEDSGCEWLKLDFNMDPEEGCSRSNHQHHENDGLYWHYQGYYDILNRIRDKYPKLVLENCASGGLRCDAAILSIVHQTFLSDVDETEHSLNSFYELSRFVPPEHILHWSWSQTRIYDDGSHAFAGFSIDDDTPETLIRYTIRAAMLHTMGFSRDFASMSDRNRAIFREEISYYKAVVRPVLRDMQIFHLQNEEGCMALQYAAKEKHLLFIFCMGGFAGRTAVIRPKGLLKEAVYGIWDRDCPFKVQRSGALLMEQGITINSGGQQAHIFELVEEKT